jgi:hypothetical protein
MKADLTDRENLLLDAIKDYVSIWNSRDAISNSRRAQGRRMRMWEKIDAALEACGITREEIIDA